MYKMDLSYQICINKVLSTVMTYSIFFFQVPYHQLTTPKWLAKHATIHGSYTYKPNYLEILARITNQYVLQVQLVPPGVLTNDDHNV